MLTVGDKLPELTLPVQQGTAALPAGEYEIRAELEGFRALVQSGLRLSVGEQASLVLRLEAGATGPLVGPKAVKVTSP